uniref:Uncharacterized protein n=1 Tax=Octopus bimaculoides TaxID=37653 RepID=A0A0L8HGU4_OCTBM
MSVENPAASLVAYRNTPTKHIHDAFVSDIFFFFFSNVMKIFIVTESLLMLYLLKALRKFAIYNKLCLLREVVFHLV